MGLGPNLTLDVTINPDFGQVEADPAEVNLSAYETFFDEQRPFFLEGADLFEGRGLYYSRRIGATPPGSADADYAERIDNTTILGAAKLTGRLPSGLSVAALAAVTDRETVATYDGGSGKFSDAIIAPRTGYAVASVQQEFGGNQSTFGATVTMVQRDVEPGTRLANLLTRSAYSAIADSRIRWADGMYDANVYFGATYIRGDSSAILRQQLSSRRYWQRPDALHVGVNDSRRTLSGTMMGISHSKVSGSTGCGTLTSGRSRRGSSRMTSAPTVMSTIEPLLLRSNGARRLRDPGTAPGTLMRGRCRSGTSRAIGFPPTHFHLTMQRCRTSGD